MFEERLAEADAAADRERAERDKEAANDKLSICKLRDQLKEIRYSHSHTSYSQEFILLLGICIYLLVWNVGKEERGEEKTGKHKELWAKKFSDIFVRLFAKICQKSRFLHNQIFVLQNHLFQAFNVSKTYIVYVKMKKLTFSLICPLRPIGGGG